MTTTTACIAPHNGDRAPHRAEVGFFCTPAYNRTQQHIAELPALSGWLQANIAGSGGGLDPNPVTSSKTRPLPIKADVFDHIEAIRFTLTSWTALVSEERNLIGCDNTRPETTATFLLAHLPWSVEQLWADDLATEVADLHRVAHQLVPSRPAVYRLPIPCPSCPEGLADFTLTRKDGDEYVSCRACGHLWTEKEYGRLMWEKAEYERNRCGWLTPEDAGIKLGVDPRVVRNWARRGLVAIVCAVLPGDHDHRLRVDPDEVARMAAAKKSA